MVFESQEPFSQARFEVYMASLLTLLSNIHRAEGSAKPKVADFLFFHEKKPTTQADLISNLTQVLGG